MSRFSIVIATLVALCGVPSIAGQGVLADLGPSGAKVFDTDVDVRVNIALSQPVPWRVHFADAPPRLIVEFKELVWSKPPDVRSTSVVDVSVGKSGPGTSQMVAILREPLTVASAEMTSLPDGTASLELLLRPTTASAFRSEVSAAQTPEAQGAEPVDGRTIVAIDPGHGGFDPGAKAGKLDEADLVLTFARRLQEMLLSTGRFDVVLTRKDDKFVSLDHRLTRARAAGADVFLSIHADALDQAGGASGMVVYTLANMAETEADDRLTERHGDDDLISGLDLSGAGDDVALALLDLTRRDTTPRTDALSGALIQAFQGAGLELNSRPQRVGEYAVLKAADIPSVLVELGFLSTEGNLQRLTSEQWQAEAARAVRDALMLWEDEDRLR